MKGYHQKKYFCYILIVVFLIALSVFVCACAPKTPTESTLPTSKTLPTETSSIVETTLPTGNQAVYRGLPGEREDRLTVGINDPKAYNLNPFASEERLFPVDPSCFYQPIYQSLFTFSPQSPAYEAILANNFQLNEQDLRIKLRHDISWHDEYPFTAKDVEFTIDAHRKLVTQKGQLLDRFVNQVTVEDEHTVVISFKPDEKNAGWHILDTLSSIPIVAEHIWAPVLSDAPTIEALLERSLRVIGTGPWKLYQEDSFSISFTKLPKDNETPGPKFLTILKYSQPGFAARAVWNSDIDLLLSSLDLGLDITGPSDVASATVRADMQYVYSGEILRGVAINYSSREELGSRAFRKLLVAIAKAHDTDASVDLRRTHVLTVPSIMNKLDQVTLQSIFGAVTEDLLSSLIEKSGLTPQPDGKLFKNDEPLKPLTLVYPEHDKKVAFECEQYAAIAATHGLSINLLPVTESVWNDKLSTGDYELIYMQSDINESMVKTVKRLSDMSATRHSIGEFVTEFDVNRAAEVLSEFPAANGREAFLTYYQKLANWMLEEHLFIPLEADHQLVATINTKIHKDLPSGSIFLSPVEFRPLPLPKE